MMFLQKHLIEFLLIALTTLTISKCNKLQEEEVSRWAKAFGDELWKLGKAATKIEEIEQKYLHSNAQVEEKDLEQLLADVVKDIERMMDRKMDAIMCIMKEAEIAAENFEYKGTNYSYCSSKYSNKPKKEMPDGNSEMYLNLTLNQDTHFYNLPVDTEQSSVHVPLNIHDKHKEAALAIQWSEALNNVFIQNYNSDPALSWQYFGSTSGIMRHYPGKIWPDEKIEDKLFDCRVRTWYIEAATCTKDVVILVDNSGSMDGMGKHIAALTVDRILATFSNNDFINVMYYNVTTYYLIPCFNHSLVQATPENIKLFNEAMKKLKPLGKTQLSQALDIAFDILAEYREKRGCSDSAESNITCNQAIMIVTDGISKNLSDTVMLNNYLNGGDTIPVRLFTYLIGREVSSNIEEIKWLSCGNRGYYSHVKNLAQVTASVLEYINVIARPLVLQGEQRPISWTHAYADVTYDDKIDEQINIPYRLLTSVAVPAFDTKANKNVENRTANLLGVAGTDVPIADIEKLTLPYKLGVNAYAFIVSNNGYVLMHRDFRPAFKGNLRENYNSIDLLEVEQFDQDLPPRKLDEVLLNLRNDIVNNSRGSMLDVPIKYHYDDMRRVTREKYDYYYSPLKGTPFSLAFAVPDGYGHYSLDVGDEIMKNRHTGAIMTDFFKGFKWKVHPNWVYCKYHYLENHEYKTPEEELTHFLDKMYEDDFKWERQYATLEEGEEEENLDEVKCGRKTHEQYDYYCDRQLIQRLVFDARNTLEAFRGWANQTGEALIFDRFNVTLRFIATMSGLTSWEYRNEESKPPGKEFGDLHSKAIDETWYKSAVIQHEYDRHSFVYSVPFDAKPDQNLAVIGSFAVYPKDANIEAPGCVVGFEFSHQKLKEKFKEFSKKLSNQCPDCEACFVGLHCYLIDNNGYILVSENDDVGTFFGDIEGDVMGSLIDENIFEKIRIYDYQAQCEERIIQNSASLSMLSNPINLVRMFVNWCITRIAWLALEINIHNLLTPLYAEAEESDEISNNESQSEIAWDKLYEIFGFLKTEKDDIKYSDCDKERDLYISQHTMLDKVEIKASRSYYVQKIPYSNLLLIAINATQPKTNFTHYSALPRDIEYDQYPQYSACQKLELNQLFRRRLTGCFDEHPEEREIKACGGATTIKLSSVILFVVSILFLRHNFYILL